MNDLAEWEFQRLYGPWSPFHPTAVRAVLDGGGFTWWVAGGWSLEADPRPPASSARGRRRERARRRARRGAGGLPHVAAAGVFKRDDRVRRPLAQVWCRGPDGVPYQRPEIGLLFKARLRRDKDVTDLAVWPRLDEPARSWLRDSLAVVSPGHPWLARLAAG